MEGENELYRLWGFKVGAMLHDIGKTATQTLDNNGIEHYYKHGEWGSYLILSKMRAFDGWRMDDLLNCCFLINYHMMPFDWNTKGEQDKWKNGLVNINTRYFYILMNAISADKEKISMRHYVL